MNTKLSFDYCQFLREAYEEYALYVKTGKKTYHRFLVDYLNGHKSPHPCEDQNEHERIMGSISELLTMRQSLVEHYFAQKSLTDDHLYELQTAHESTDAGQHIIEKEARRKTFQANVDRTAKMKQAELLNYNMNEKQLDAIASLISGRTEGFACLVQDDIEGGDVYLFFKGEKTFLLMKEQNYKMIMLLDALACHDLIRQDWRRFLSYHESLVSSKNNQPMTQNQMWRSLSEGKKKHGGLYKKYLQEVQEIANCQ